MENDYSSLQSGVEDLLASFDTDSPDDSTLSIDDVADRLGEALASPKPGEIISGWKGFNSALNGIRPNEFTILCGPTGAGKTMLLANIASKLSETQTACHIVPVETGAKSFVSKMAGIHLGKIISSSEGMPEKEYAAFRERFKEVFSSQRIMLSSYETRVSHTRLMCDIYNSYFKHNCKVFLIDNLNFMMDVVSSRDTISEMDRVVHDLVVFCKTLPIHIIMVMHPKKTEGGRVESEFDIKGSSTSVQEASNVILFNRLSDSTQLSTLEEPSRPFYRELKFVKIRENGSHTGKRIYLRRDIYSEILREQEI